MKITLTCAVLHLGQHLDAGASLDIGSALAESWIARGLATSGAAPTSAPAPRDPLAVAALAETAALRDYPAAALESAEAVTEAAVAHVLEQPTQPQPRKRHR